MIRLILTFTLVLVPPAVLAGSGPVDHSTASPGGPARPAEHYRSEAEANKPVRVIIELKDKPVLEQLQVSNISRSGYSTRSASGARTTTDIGYAMQSYALQLRKRQAATISKLTSKKLISGAGRRFNTVANAFVAEAKPKDFQKIRAMDAVANVHIDRQVEVLLDKSVNQIGAPTAWEMLDAEDRPIRGEGITVAIIDTGVDYTHPDLGGCLGEGCKVVGGYDFVDDDPDPMDENFHGTHVAGIVAADGTVTGVAPDASLLAYKALDANGSGSDSGIIAAIEMAVNPDGDLTTPDGADVINLSLGGYPNYSVDEDPMVQAVEQAVDAGVVVVIAAGNDGAWGEYGIVSSPGIAPQAITVAAVDDLGELAGFSSWGNIPYQLDRTFSGLKPEVSAPGVEIMSTTLEHDHEPASGTSMATPHIAGVVALLLQHRPDLAPSDIKSLLMSSVASNGFDPYQAGSGIVDVVAAMNTQLLFEPSVLNFGYIESGGEEVARAVDVTVRNISGEAIDLSAVITESLPAGSALDFSEFPEAVPSNDEVSASVSLSVNPGQIGHRDSVNQPYFSKLRISSEAQDLFLPVFFNRAEILEIKQTEVPGYNYAMATVYADGKTYQVEANTGESGQEVSMYLALPNKSATIFLYNFGGKIFARTGIDPITNAVVEFSLAEEGIQPPELMSIDGDPLEYEEQRLEIGLLDDSGVKRYYSYGGNISFGSIVGISDDFEVNYHATARGPDSTDTNIPLYVFSDSMLGSSRPFNYDLSALHTHEMLVNREGWEKRAVNVQAFNAYYQDGWTNWAYSPQPDIPPRTRPFLIAVHSISPPHFDQSLFSIFRFLDFSEDEVFGESLGDTYQLRFSEGRYRKYRGEPESAEPERVIIERDGAPILWGLGPKFWALGAAYKDNSLSLVPHINNYAGASAILDSWANTYNIEIPYSLSCLDTDLALASGTLNLAKIADYIECSKLQFSASYTHTLDSVDYTSSIELEINSTEPGETPRVAMLELSNGGVIDHYLSRPESHLTLRVEGGAELDEVTVEIRHDDGDWQPLPTVQSGRELEIPISIPETMTVAALRITLSDQAGNSYHSVMNGAFLMGADLPGIIDSDGDGWVDADDAFRFDPGQWVGPDILAGLSPLSLDGQTVARGTKDIVVQRFQLNVDSPFTTLSSITVQAQITGEDAETVTGASLYLDANSDGVLDEEDTLLAQGATAGDAGSLTFELSEPYSLPEGNSDFLVTYNF